MRLALIPQSQSQPLTIHAAAEPPRNRTTRTERALQECKDAWLKAYRVAQEKGLATVKAQRMACVAYKLAFPKMVDLPSIRAAVSCIVQGITLEVFDGRDGSQLLYAAQVALSVLKQKGERK